jgi:hypothetical protein
MFYFWSMFYFWTMDGLVHLDPAVGAPPSPAFMGFFAALANVRSTGEARLARISQRGPVLEALVRSAER